MEFHGRFREGRFIPEDPVRFAAYVAHVGDRRVRVAFNREVRHHSGNQRRYYWGLVVATISEWSGHTKDEIHSAMKHLFLPPLEITLPTGEIVHGEPSTRKLSLEEYSEYVSRVMAWAAQNGLYIPAAGEY